MALHPSILWLRRCALFAPWALAAASCAPAEQPQDLNRIWGVLQPHQESVAFPDTVVGQQVAVDTQFTNTGAAAVTAHVHVEGPPDVVAVSALHWTLQPGQTATVDVQLLALEAATVRAVLVVDHDGQEPARVEVQLTGSVQLPDCNDDNPCTLDAFDPQAPQGCSHTALAGPCDDSNLCTTADSCVAGECVGISVQCEDGVACTADRCNPETGACEFVPMAQRCNDADPCTDDVCQPGGGADLSGCRHTLAPTGTPCGAAGCGTVALCQAGACVNHATPEGYPCEDGDPCTQQDSCHGGVCTPGSGGGLTLGGPVLVSGGADPEAYRLGGQGPARLDGVVVVPTPPEAALARVIWRGTYSGPGACHQPGSCTQYPPSLCELTDEEIPTLALNATVVDTTTGEALRQHNADLSQLHQAVRQQEGAVLLADHEPEGTVASVDVARLGNGTAYVAAVVRFADSCANCWLRRHSGMEITDEEPYCLPAGDALAIYTLDDDGFHLWFARWLSGWEAYGGIAGTAEDANGEPLLGIAEQDGNATVMVAHYLQSACADLDCDGCSCAEEVAMEAFISNPGLQNALGQPVTRQSVNVSLPPWVNPRLLRDFSVHVLDGFPTATWTQPGDLQQEPFGAVCSSAAPLAQDLMQLQMDNGEAEPVPVRLASAVQWGGRVVDAQGPGAVVWETQGRLEDDACMPVDTVRVLGDGQGNLLMQTNAGGPLVVPAMQRVSVEVLNQQAVALGVSEQGSLVAGVGTGGAVPRQRESRFASADTRFSPQWPAHGDMTEHLGTVAVLAEVPSGTSLWPTTVLSTVSVSCGFTTTW